MLGTFSWLNDCSTVIILNDLINISLKVNRHITHSMDQLPPPSVSPHLFCGAGHGKRRESS